MAIEISTPSFHGNDHEKMGQIERYLFQLAQQLQWALRDIDSAKNHECEVTRDYLAKALEEYITTYEFERNKKSVADNIKKLEDEIFPV